MKFTIQRSTFIEIAGASKKELLDMSEVEKLDGITSRVTKSTLAIKLLLNASKKYYEEYFSISDKIIKKMYKKTRKGLENMAKKAGIKQISKKNIAQLRISIFDEKSKKKTRVKNESRTIGIKKITKKHLQRIGSPFFIEDENGDYQYNDPFLTGNDLYSEYLIILKRLTTDVTAEHILNFLTDSTKISPPLYDGRTEAEFLNNKWRDQDEEFDLKHADHSDCEFHKCFNIFQNFRYYNEFAGYKFCGDRDIDDPFDYGKHIHKENYKVLNHDVFEELEENYKLTSYPLVSGWRSKLVYIPNGNCLKDSLFKMREMILEKYSDVIELSSFGVINDEKRFTELANSIDDHDIDSLDYFNFLLSTGSVHFIDHDGRPIYKTTTSSLLVPTFYHCFFLIETNKDGITGHISPIDFGILKTAEQPTLSPMTSLKRLYGHEDYTGVEDWIRDYFYRGNGLIQVKLKVDTKKILKINNNPFCVSRKLTESEKKFIEWDDLDEFTSLVTSAHNVNKCKK